MLSQPGIMGEYLEFIFKAILVLTALIALFIAYGPIENRGQNIENRNRKRRLDLWRREINRFIQQCDRLVDDKNIHGPAVAHAALRNRASALRARLNDQNKAEALLSNSIAVCTRTAILAGNEAHKLHEAFDQTRRVAMIVFTEENHLKVKKLGRL